MQTANEHLLREFLANGQIRLQPGRLLEWAPGPLPEGSDFGRVESMLLGLAIGDALGNTNEGLRPAARRAIYGEIRDYLPNRWAGGQRVGLPSDDTQLAFRTVEQMLADGAFVPEHVAARFCTQRIFGIGSTVRQFVANFRAGLPWYRCGPESAGNGALMRIAPLLAPHVRSGTAALWADTALSAMMTHNDAGSTAACLAFVSMLWQLLQMPAAPEPEWWPAAYVDAARDLEGETAYHARGGEYAEYRGPIWRFVADHVTDAYRRGVPAVEACNSWLSGAYLLETVPSVIYILMRHGDDPTEAIVRAVNDTMDNDTTAATVGAAMGALHGKERWPAGWIGGLLGRTGPDDDGRVFQLLAEARRAWWEAPIRSGSS